MVKIFYEFLDPCELIILIKFFYYLPFMIIFRSIIKALVDDQAHKNFLFNDSANLVDENSKQKTK